MGTVYPRRAENFMMSIVVDIQLLTQTEITWNNRIASRSASRYLSVMWNRTFPTAKQHANHG